MPGARRADLDLFRDLELIETPGTGLDQRAGRWDDTELCAIGDRAASPGPGDDRRSGTAEPIITWLSTIGRGCHPRLRTKRPEAGQGGPPRPTSSGIQPIAGCAGPVANRPLATGRGGRRSP